jgi:hypothetical protein
MPTCYLVATFNRPIGPGAAIVGASLETIADPETIGSSKMLLLQSQYDGPLSHCTDMENFISEEDAMLTLLRTTATRWPALLNLYPLRGFAASVGYGAPEDLGGMRPKYGGPPPPSRSSNPDDDEARGLRTIYGGPGMFGSPRDPGFSGKK